MFGSLLAAPGSISYVRLREPSKESLFEPEPQRWASFAQRFLITWKSAHCWGASSFLIWVCLLGLDEKVERFIVRNITIPTQSFWQTAFQYHSIQLLKYLKIRKFKMQYFPSVMSLKQDSRFSIFQLLESLKICY